jgi:hypothetical protein
VRRGAGRQQDRLGAVAIVRAGRLVDPDQQHLVGVRVLDQQPGDVKRGSLLTEADNRPNEP